MNLVWLFVSRCRLLLQGCYPDHLHIAFVAGPEEYSASVPAQAVQTWMAINSFRGGVNLGAGRCMMRLQERSSGVLRRTRKMQAELLLQSRGRHLSRYCIWRRPLLCALACKHTRPFWFALHPNLYSYLTSMPLDIHARQLTRHSVRHTAATQRTTRLDPKWYILSLLAMWTQPSSSSCSRAFFLELRAKSMLVVSFLPLVYSELITMWPLLVCF